jgi:hypothetical protein
MAIDDSLWRKYLNPTSKEPTAVEVRSAKLKVPERSEQAKARSREAKKDLN